MRCWRRRRLLFRSAVLATVLSWSEIARSNEVGPGAGVAAVEPGPSPGPWKLTLHPWGGRPALRGLANGTPPAQDQLLLDSPLSTGVAYLHLAVTGGDRAGLLPFLRISATSFAGLRIRF